MTDKKDITILYSGGIDSLGMLTYAKYNNYQSRCLFFDIGQPYAAKEKAALPNGVEVRKVDWLKGESGIRSKDALSGNIIIPGRNLALLCLAACITTPDELWLGALAGETHQKATDKNFIFLSYAQGTLRYTLKDFCPDVKVRFPFAELSMNKLAVVKFMLNVAKVDPQTIINTSSCLSGSTGKCGECIVCLRRWGIFHQVGLCEEYEKHPLECESNYRIIVEMMRPDSHYDNFRKEEILPALLDYDPALYCNLMDRVISDKRDNEGVQM